MELGNSNYQPNSNKFKKEEAEKAAEKRAKKVVSAPAKTKKKNEIRKLADVFISEDATNVKSYILMDVLIPAVKKAVYDIVTSGVDMILYGGTGGGSKRRINADRVSYRDYNRISDRRDDTPSRSNNAFDYEDIVFQTRGDAIAVRDQMDDLIEAYGVVRVSDIYDMAEMTAPYTANRYGWTSIRTAEPVRVRDGYVLKLPRPMPVD